MLVNGPKFSTRCGEGQVSPYKVEIAISSIKMLAQALPFVVQSSLDIEPS
jgi:hypothetical protein